MKQMTWLNAFWILDRGVRVGTVAFEITEHRQFVPVYSLYVYPEHRGRGLAYNLLRSVDTACPSAGFEGVRVGAYWTWQADVRRYLSRYKMWARSFKRSIDFVWSDLPSHAIAIDEELAQFAIEYGGTSIASFERLDRSRGFVPRTPTIPGLDDAIGREPELD